MQNGLMLQAVYEEPGRPSHMLDYVALAVIVGLGVFLYFFVAYSTVLKIEAFFIFLLLYLLWGLLHHHKEQTLTWHVVADYVSFSAFLGVLLTVVVAVT